MSEPITPPADDGLDEFGYAKVIPPTPPVDDKKPIVPPVPPKDEVIVDPATGYGKEPPTVKPPEPVPPPAIDLGYELDVKDIDIKDVTKIKEFAKANTLTKEVAQALVNLKKSEIQAAITAKDEAEKQRKLVVEQTKLGWDKELRTHSTFGGDNFASNVMKVEKVLGEFMKETKKALTERGSMLPPYVMRDLAALADKLYANEKLVQGDPVIPPKEEKESNPLDFYV